MNFRELFEDVKFFSFCNKVVNIFVFTDIGTCAITAIPFGKSKVLFTLEELDEFAFVDETDQQAVPDVTRIGPSQEKWGWIMFECGIENLTIKGKAYIGFILFCFMKLLTILLLGLLV